MAYRQLGQKGGPKSEKVARLSFGLALQISELGGDDELTRADTDKSIISQVGGASLCLRNGPKRNDKFISNESVNGEIRW